MFPHNDGLYHALCLNRIRQLLQGFVIDLNTRLIAAGLDIFNCNRGQSVAAAVVYAVGEQRIQTAPQSAFYFCHAFLPYVFKCNDKVGILSDIECCRQFVSVFISNRFFHYNNRFAAASGITERRMMTRRLIVGISGASGFAYGIKALRLLLTQDVETHLVVSKGAEMARTSETDYTKDEVYALADFVHPIGNIGACIASGTFKTDGMLVAPCSMRTLASVAHGFGDNLLTRAADVVLKERRRLVLMVRETPLNLAHLDNMKRVTEMGGVVFPPVPAMYRKPQTADDIVTHSVAHALSLFGIDTPDSAEWQGIAD